MSWSIISSSLPLSLILSLFFTLSIFPFSFCLCFYPLSLSLSLTSSQFFLTLSFTVSLSSSPLSLVLLLWKNLIHLFPSVSPVIPHSIILCLPYFLYSCLAFISFTLSLSPQSLHLLCDGFEYGIHPLMFFFIVWVLSVFWALLVKDPQATETQRQCRSQH